MKVTGHELQKVLDMILAFRDQTDTDNLLNEILTKLMDLTNSDAGTIYIMDGGKLQFRILRNDTLGLFSQGDQIDLPPIDTTQVPIRTIAAYAAVHNQVVIIDDVYDDAGNTKGFNFEGTKAYDALVGYRTQSMIAIPLFAESGPHNNFKAEVVGVVQLINKRDSAGTVVPYGDESDNELTVTLSRLISSFLVTHVYLGELKTLFKSIVSMMSLALDERSVYNTRHTQNVTNYVGQFSKWLSQRFAPGSPYHFHETRRDQLIMAALVHDIGKMLTPLEVMNKATKLGDKLVGVRYRFNMRFLQLENSWLRKELDELSYRQHLQFYQHALQRIEHYNDLGYIDDEALAEIESFRALSYRDVIGNLSPLLSEEEIEILSVRRGNLTLAERKIMQDHVTHTANLLGKITVWRYFSDIPKWASDHHELLDGTGYPKGLSGDEIAIETRILTIADIFDALTANDRPYKKALSTEKSLSILQEMADNGKLDSELVALFIESEAWASVEG